jgi:hypothetical protein
MFLFCAAPKRRIFSVSIMLLALSPIANAKTFFVHSEKTLYQAVTQANKNNQPDMIKLARGEYQLAQRLIFSEPNTHLMGESGIASEVVVSGKGMQRSRGVEILLDIQADHISVTGLTLQNVANHLIQVRAEKDADYFKLSNSILRNAYEQMLKVSSYEGNPHFSDAGQVENCVFEYTEGIGPQFYIGGIDAHKSANWVVQHNQFKGIASPDKRVAEHAIHFWKGSKGTQVLHNTFINNDRGVGFGLGNRKNQHDGGIIKNNVFFHYANEHPYADTSIGLESSPNTQVVGNTIYQSHRYPNAIEYRFKYTQNVVIRNNQVNKRIASRDGGQAMVSGNVKLR